MEKKTKEWLEKIKIELKDKKMEDDENLLTTIEEVIEGFFKYKELEDKGLLVKFPCKIKDTVFVIFKNKVEPCKIRRFYQDVEGNWNMFYESDVVPDNNINEFGKEVFLTREEAERFLENIGA